MIDMIKITRIIELFLAFNYVEGAESMSFEYSEYDDRFFRWTRDSFSHGEKFSVIFNDKTIRMFNTKKVKERLVANVDKLKNNPIKTHFGCKNEVVKDLIMEIPIQELTDEDIKEIESQIIELEQIQGKRAKELADIQKRAIKDAPSVKEGSKLTNNPR